MEEGFLGSLEAAARSALVDLGVRKTWEAGAVVFREGDPADHVIIIESGVVKAVVASAVGSEWVVALRGPGELLGELGAVDGGLRSASIVAVKPVTAIVVPAGTFRDFLVQFPSAALALIDAVARRVRDSSRRQAEFGSTDSGGRLARLLIDLAKTYGRSTDHGVEVRLLSQDELAEVCGASREAVARGLRTLRDAGLITTGRRSVTIVDMAGLAAWVP